MRSHARKYTRRNLLTAGVATALVAGAGVVGTATASPSATSARTSGTVVGASYAPGTFVHPGVLNSSASLAYVRAKVAAGAEPWKSADAQMMASRYAALSYTPHPRAVVECGSYSNPDLGCSDERQDAIAAYTDALAWSITGKTAYARKSEQIMDAWSGTITSHTDSNAPLQTAWAGTVWPQAAEIIRYTYGSWPLAGRFATMLKQVYLPEVVNGSNANGNWELSMMDASVGISVFLNDRSDYDKAVTRFLNRVKAYIYLPADGPLPYTVPGSGLTTRAQIIRYWQGQSTFVAGLTQETCRDLTHTGYGLNAISEVAQTSRLQGVSLWPAVRQRLQQALEFQTTYQGGAAVPSWLCGGRLRLGLGPVTEIGYDELHHREGLTMTDTGAYTRGSRPQGTDNLFVAWQTLTQGENPD